MQHYNYLIIGGGMTADAAAKGIRETDTKGSIAIISNEDHPPYNRPPLSKSLWKGDGEDTIWRKTNENNVTMVLSHQATSINAKGKTVTDSSGDIYTYDKLLLATGGIINKLPFEVEGIIYFRTVDDYTKLRALSIKATEIVVIGGGFIGSEIAAALAMNGKKVTMIFPEAAIGARVYPSALASFLNSYYESKGVTVLANDGVIGIEKSMATYTISTKSGKTLKADVVVAGIGVKPNTALAAEAGLKVENGIVVDENLCTSEPNIYAAGDVANFYSPALGKRVRVEHEDNSNVMGAIAGRNMAGANEKYNYLPFFYSDLFDLGYEAVGELDTRLEIVEDWKEPFKEGVIYYLESGKVRGVLLWNTWGQVDHARELIASGDSFDAGALKGKLPKE
ncbi:MAG TPA: FAD/NAD(P)-binding oxidoreductase [Chitinophagales bacterium]|nr:FAD/NAD(P)-binding oxidoreductase [Chitinophagales bacterium]